MAQAALRLASDTHFDQLTRYARKVADSMGLRDHEIEVEHHPCEDEKMAECVLTPPRRHIGLRVCRDFFDLPPVDQRYTVVHEFVHAIFGRMCVVVEEGAVGWMPPRTFEMFQGTFTRELEEAVHALSSVLANDVPLPDFAS